MKLAIIDKRFPEAAKRQLMLLGFRIAEIPPANNIPVPMASHPDMLMARLGDNIVTTADFCDTAAYIFSDIREAKPDVKIHFTDENFGEEYPHDAILNVLIIGKFAFMKCDTVSRYLLSLAKELGYEIIDVKQGYPACTVLPLGDSAAITSDKGMARAMRSVGIDVTVISDGGILLPPYEYGFIGGAAGVLDGTVYFIGDPKTHTDGKIILDAITRHGFRQEKLCDGPLYDLGRIIFI